MKKVLATLVLCAAPVSMLVASEADMQKRVQDSREVIQQFAQQLQGELGKAMREGGPVKAIEACNAAAPAIAEAASREHGWTIARTSDKLRNPANAPDEWEAAVLAKFAERVAQGESPAGMGHFEVVSQNGREVFRFMSAIGMPAMEQAPCLMCHGESIKPEVMAKLNELYPKDQATGYQAGMLRGAFTITQPLD